MPPFLSEFLTLAFIHLLAVAAPGPDFAIVLRQCLRHGRRIAIFTAIGIGLGILLHMTYTLLGIGLLISRSTDIFNVIKLPGATWLIYLGVQSLRARPALEPTSDTEQSCAAQTSWHNALWIGFLTNGLNPKVTLFFLAIFTAVVSRDTPLWIQAAYGLYLSLATMVWFSLLALLLGHPRVRQELMRAGVWLERLTGVVLIGFGMKLALS